METEQSYVQVTDVFDPARIFYISKSGNYEGIYNYKVEAEDEKSWFSFRSDIDEPISAYSDWIASEHWRYGFYPKMTSLRVDRNTEVSKLEMYEDILTTLRNWYRNGLDVGETREEVVEVILKVMGNSFVVYNLKQSIRFAMKKILRKIEKITRVY